MNKWWRDAEELRRRFEQYGSFAELARQTGVPSSTIRTAWSDLGLEKPEPNHRVKPVFEYKEREPPFWHDRELLQEKVRHHVTLDQTAAAEGVSSKTLQVWWRRHGLTPFSPGPRRGPQSRPGPEPGVDSSWLLGALKKLGDTATASDLADLLDVSPKRVREEFERLGDMGYRLTEEGPTIKLERRPPDTVNVHKNLFNGERVRFAVISDTHLCSREERVDELHTACAMIEEEGIDIIFHPGDVVAGIGIYQGQTRDLHTHTYDEQVQYAADTLPRGKFRWKAISGNHDLLGDAARAGFDPVRALANIRDDIDYCGEYSAWFELPNGGWMHMLHPGGGASYALCHDDQTEILTEDSGWVKFTNLLSGQRVATLDSDGYLEWQEPTGYTAEWYEGEMVQFGGGRTSCYDLLVTPNHRMWVRRPYDSTKTDAIGKTYKGQLRGEDWRFVDARDINARGWKLQRGFSWHGSETEVPFGFDAKMFASFMGWYISEGSCNPANNQVQISQRNTSPYYDDISILIEELGFTAGCYSEKIAFSNKEMADYLKPFGHSHDKFVPAWIKDAEPDVIYEFLSSYWCGDGTFVKELWWSATTVSRRLADDIQELIFKLGLTSCVQQQEPTADRHWPRGGVTLVQNQKTRYVITATRTRQEVFIEKPPVSVDYQGMIYCVTVPNGIVLTRRNGKPAFSGNSYKPQRLCEGYEAGRKPNLLLIGHYHRRGSFRHREIEAILCGTFEGSTNLAKRYGMGQPAVGFHIVEFTMGEDGSMVRFRLEWLPFFFGRVID